MAAITGVVVVVLLVGAFFLWRVMGSMGQRPSAQERAKHSADERTHGGPRATGLN